MATDFDMIHEDESEGDEFSVIPRRPIKDDTQMDITPMIDITFLLLIFFIVASKMADPASAELPKARHSGAVEPKTCTIITITNDGPLGALIYLADDAEGTPLGGNLEQRSDDVRAAVEAGVAKDKPNVMIKAAKGVLHRHVAEVVEAARSVDPTGLHIAVMEVD